ncbi:MAG: hypothetical protein JEY99_13400 [Spirochaetales bacterium]|nr:hypothetical protein [Spirochaetales bacterium]
MISLEQIQKLNIKVQNALDVIVSLREENVTLREKLSGYEKRMEELEVLVNSFSRDQDDIETGILNILQQLDKLEDDFSSHDEESSEIESKSEVVSENVPEPDTDIKRNDSEAVMNESVPEETVEEKTTKPETEEISSREVKSEDEAETELAVTESSAEAASSQDNDSSINSENKPSDFKNAPAASVEETGQNSFEKSEPEAELDIF